MANDIALFRDKNATLPAHLNRGIDDITKNLMGNSGAGKRISIKGGVWRMVVGGEEIDKIEERNLDVVIVNAAAKTSRSYYAGAYSEDSAGAMPDCWSNDGTKPDSKSEAPQASSCANCPMNIAGSGQGTSRACRFHRRIAVVLANNVEGDVYQLVLPAQSIFGKAEDGKMPLEAYARFIGGHSLSINSVVTELKFDTASATPKIIFRAVRPLTEDEMDVVIEQGQSQDAVNAVTFNPAQTDRQGAAEKSAAAKPKVEKKEPEVFRDEPAEEPKAKKAKPAPASAPVEEEVEEPTVRTKAKTEESKELTDVLSAWGDDDED